ncbi:MULTISPECIES: flagellar export chaperone FliS [unclassified Oceanispirochaeta]|uniref:flagellar export chaperone FliS n=1 Tax=unclassified Oceanispirochaeta TaxID=2635722 RepID=UPI000E08FFD4|nr:MULTISPECIES: flagellar export chaperone FliS [unclassified Oceanispirochaeta]MBF9014722.1 flagellar export chaperone FliS [Oceanispirochaeta sp. M2]NPD70978.1 flagellar export chaperone FliS [Oceanispirochaeta sp. M1]RDG33811.1 flagellar export chaperone FliS [Oceanispirochaeta sp. M1]
MNKNPLNAYRQTKVKTASQGRLIVMLYDEALKQLDIGIEEMNRPQKRLDKVHNCIVKTQDVITELMASLDFEKGGDIATNLYNLYMFFNKQLLQANMDKTSDSLSEIRRMMNELRTAWASIEGQPHTGASPLGVNIAG